LHPRGRKRVKTRQLAATGGESQRERLDAVSEEVTSGEGIVGVDTVVDLGDEASEIVVRRDITEAVPGVGVNPGPGGVPFARFGAGKA